MASYTHISSVAFGRLPQPCFAVARRWMTACKKYMSHDRYLADTQFFVQRSRVCRYHPFFPTYNYCCIGDRNTTKLNWEVDLWTQFHIFRFLFFVVERFCFLLHCESFERAHIIIWLQNRCVGTLRECTGATMTTWANFVNFIHCFCVPVFLCEIYFSSKEAVCIVRIEMQRMLFKQPSSVVFARS